MRKTAEEGVRIKKLNSKSVVRTGVAYKREERREQKKKKNRLKSKKEAWKKQKEYRGKEKSEKESKEHRIESVIRSLPKRRSTMKTEARAKDVAKKYQIEGSNKMKANRKRTD